MVVEGTNHILITRSVKLSLTVMVFWLVGCQSQTNPFETKRTVVSPIGYAANHDSYKNYNTNHAQATSTAQDAHEVARIRTQMAAQYLANHQLDEARRQLDKAFAADDRYAPAYDMMGVLLQREGSPLNTVKAEQLFQQAIKIDPNFMPVRNNYGVYLSQRGKYQQAIEQFEIAGAALGYEGRIKALENLGITMLKVGNNQQATQIFVRILESDRDNILAHIELVDILLNNGRVAQAQNLYNEILAIVGDEANQIPRIVEQGIKLTPVDNN